MKKNELYRAAVIGGLAVTLLYLLFTAARKGERVTPVPFEVR